MFSAKKFYRTFGSLKLAVVTLSSLALLLIFSTFYESKTSTRQVQAVIYQSWWFIALLFVLGLNVFCAAMSRYPWKGYQTGFVITHLGIIILLTGSIIGLRFGVEGNITMVEKGPPRGSLMQDHEIIQITRRDTGQSISVPVEADQKPLAPGEVRPLKAGRSGLEVALKALDANTKEDLTVKDGGKQFNPAIKFSFSSALPGMGQNMQFSDWLLLNDPDRSTLSMGPAVFKVEALDSEEAIQKRLRPPAATTGKGVLTLNIDQQTLQIPVQDFLDKDYQSPDGKVTVKLQKYFADLRMVAKEPVSVSDIPRNPAVFFEITAANRKSKGFAFADYPEMNIVQGEAGPDKDVQVTYNFERDPQAGSAPGVLNTITVLVGPHDRLYYTSASARSGFHAAEIKVGAPQEIAPNSPMKPELKIEEFHSHPEIARHYIPVETNAMTEFLFPAVELRLKHGNETAETMVRWGENKNVKLGGVDYGLTYGWATVPLDFTLQLERFEMPKYEGTEEASGYESYVKVKDAKTGEEFSQKIWMNHPMTYKGYRLSQAGFDLPKDGVPYRSTLQVLRDPGWAFKGIGSLLIVLGIITMFYIKPYFKGLQKERARRAAVEKISSKPPEEMVAARAK